MFTAGPTVVLLTVSYFESLRQVDRDVFVLSSGGGMSVVIRTVLDQTLTAKGSNGNHDKDWSLSSNLRSLAFGKQ